jgi:uncharacterized BrkB/YihY/UPF0761 family membrane protein
VSNAGNLNCPFCNKEIRPTDTYCPNCGTKLPDVDLPFSTKQKIKIYLISVFLAPLGLYWFFKYFKNEDTDKRRTAFIALYITIFMLLTSGAVIYYYYLQIPRYMEMYNYSGLGL